MFVLSCVGVLRLRHYLLPIWEGGSFRRLSCPKTKQNIQQSSLAYPIILCPHVDLRRHIFHPPHFSSSSGLTHLLHANISSALHIFG